VEPLEQPTQEPPTKKRRTRKPRSYTVGLNTNNHKSVTSIEKSSPLSAASSVVRSSISHVPLQQPQTVTVQSLSKNHTYTVHRDYTNPKFRRFTIAKIEQVKEIEPDTQEPEIILTQEDTR